MPLGLETSHAVDVLCNSSLVSVKTTSRRFSGHLIGAVLFLFFQQHVWKMSFDRCISVQAAGGSLLLCRYRCQVAVNLPRSIYTAAYDETESVVFDIHGSSDYIYASVSLLSPS